jgi:hypothetical protein
MENLKNKLVEDITTPGAGDPNIAQVDQNLSVDNIFQQTNIQSLARQVCSTVQLTGPSGSLFNIIKKPDGFKLIRKDLLEVPSQILKTGITREAIQDLMSQFGKDANTIIGTLFRGISNEIENDALLDVLKTQGKDYGNLQLTESTNAEMNLFEITQRVHEIILKMNQQYQRTFDAFAIIPYKPLGGIMGLSQYAGAVKKDERGLFITQIGSTKFYLNPDVNDTSAYVGLKDSDNLSKSSLVFAPYINQIMETVDPDSGEVLYFLVNRFALDSSPLHEVGNEMIYKFNILLS